MSRPSVTLIVNPAAGRGRGARRLPDARRAFAELDARVVLTAAPGDERRLAREALDAGATAIAVLGGDGTWSNVAGVILGAGGACVLAPLDAGTGSDFVKSVRAPAGDAAATARLLAAGSWTAVDAGSVDGEPFINVASFGFSASVTAAAARARWLRGDALYLHAALAQLFHYRAFAAGVRTPAGDAGLAPRHLMLAVANGRRFGGKFEIAPGASVTDGLLDVVHVGDAGPLGRARLFALAARGRHVGEPEVRVIRERDVTLRFDAPPTFEADGELRTARGTEVEVRCLPGALRVAYDAGAAGAPA